MNSLTIIGNLTADPESRTTSQGKQVTTFTVAVSKRGKPEEADFFRVSAWDKLADNCKRYLAKGRKVAVTGSVSASAYKANDGQARASLEVSAVTVEFLTPKAEQEPAAPAKPKQDEYLSGDDKLPF